MVSVAWYDNIVNLFPRAPKAGNTKAFTWGQELSNSGSNTLCTQDGCQVIVALVIKVEEVLVGGGGYFLKQDVK